MFSNRPTVVLENNLIIVVVLSEGDLTRFATFELLHASDAGLRARKQIARVSGVFRDLDSTCGDHFGFHASMGTRSHSSGKRRATPAKTSRRLAADVAPIQVGVLSGARHNPASIRNNRVLMYSCRHVFQAKTSFLGYIADCLYPPLIWKLLATVRSPLPPDSETA
jgi:hypothetical protein